LDLAYTFSSRLKPKAIACLRDPRAKTKAKDKTLITGPPNGPVLFCWLLSVVVVCRRL